MSTESDPHISQDGVPCRRSSVSKSKFQKNLTTGNFLLTIPYKHQAREAFSATSRLEKNLLTRSHIPKDRGPYPSYYGYSFRYFRKFFVRLFLRPANPILF